ncbi:MAG: flagellar biosynthesis anti-sigma factor FlgM [Arenicella sp.]|jgi:flagellar biosynthesis anti-sigma factor FlgM
MVDSISPLGKIPTHTYVSSEKPNQATDQALPERTTSAKPMADEFVLSADAEQALSTAEFDTEMVARIKTAISEGNYLVNSEVVAEKFAALEDMIFGD